MRDGDLATADNAKEFVRNLFSPERYDLSRVGRYQFNQRFHLSVDEKSLAGQVLTLEDFVRIISHIIHLNVTPGSQEDDIDHLIRRDILKDEGRRPADRFADDGIQAQFLGHEA